MQQASIIGNIEAFGMLQKPKDLTNPFCQECDGSDDVDGDESRVSAVVEFGAGRGYLTHMLTDCYGIKKAFLVERKSYKLKVKIHKRKKKKSWSNYLLPFRIFMLLEVNLEYSYLWK